MGYSRGFRVPAPQPDPVARQCGGGVPRDSTRSSAAPVGVVASPADGAVRGHRNPFEQDGGGRRRDRQLAVGGANPAFSRHDGAREDFGDAELLESLDAPDDVDQRVPRPDLVQGDVSGRDAMHAPLGFAQQREGPNRALPHPGESGARSIIAISSPTWR